MYALVPLFSILINHTSQIELPELFVAEKSSLCSAHLSILIIFKGGIIYFFNLKLQRKGTNGVIRQKDRSRQKESVLSLIQDNVHFFVLPFKAGFALSIFYLAESRH